MTPLRWLALLLGILATATLILWFARRRLRRAALHALHDFRTRLARYKLQERRLVKAALEDDPAITAAVHEHMAAHGLPEAAVRRRVNVYVDEIVPHFNVLSYYKLGYNLARIFVNLLYKVSVDY